MQARPYAQYLIQVQLLELNNKHLIRVSHIGGCSHVLFLSYVHTLPLD